MGFRHDFRDRIVRVVIGLAAGCALALTGCSGSTDSTASTDSTDSVDMEVPDAAAAPVVVLRPDGWEPPMPTEAAILADRILRREGDRLLLDETERRQLAGEIVLVLSSIRDAYPQVADIAARTPYAFGELVLELEPQLFEAVVSLLDDQTGPVTLQTGYAEFDSLNETMGLSVVVNLFRRFQTVTFFYSEYLNVPAAAAAYGMLEGIEYAEPNAYVGDGPDLNALESEGRWYMVARRAWGDCPAGCIDEELLFFIVDDTAVEMIDSEGALDIAEFEELVTSRVW